MGQASKIAESWNAEYRSGRYANEPPIPFVRDILSVAQDRGITRGLYIGCGNGRNFVPLIEGGLDLEGLDLSEIAIQQLWERLPNHHDRLRVGDISALPPGAIYPLVIGIQVFQHGDREETHRQIRAAQELVERGGLFCLRVNATGTQIERRNEVVESEADGSQTVRYVDGPKAELLIHFFGRTEVEKLFAEAFVPSLPLSLRTIAREHPSHGNWCQWEGIWQKT